MARLFLLLLVAGILISSGLHVQKHFIDYPVYAQAAEKLIHGQWENLFDRDRNTPGGYYYPFFFAFCFIPIALLGVELGKLVWWLIFGLAITKTIWFALKQLPAPKQTASQRKTLLAFCLLALNTYAINDAYMNANIAPLLLALCILSFEYKNKSTLASGFYLAMAIGFKVYPLMLVGYFIWEKQWRVVAGTLFFSVLFLVALPMIWAGGTLQLVYDQFFVMSHFGEHWSYASGVFQSLPASLFRAAVGLGIPLLVHPWWVIGLGPVLLVAIFWKSFVTKNPVSTFYKYKMFALALAAVPMLIPVSWYNVAIFYVPLIALQLNAAFERDKVAKMGMVTYAFLFCLTTPDLIGSSLNDQLERLSIPFLGLLVLVGSYLKSQAILDSDFT